MKWSDEHDPADVDWRNEYSGCCTVLVMVAAVGALAIKLIIGLLL